MDRCTLCRARLSFGQETCQRCGMELGRIWEVMAETESLDKNAARAMLDGDLPLAEQLLEQRLNLRRDAFVEELLSFVRMLSENDASSARPGMTTTDQTGSVWQRGIQLYSALFR